MYLVSGTPVRPSLTPTPTVPVCRVGLERVRPYDRSYTQIVTVRELFIKQLTYNLVRSQRWGTGKSLRWEIWDP